MEPWGLLSAGADHCLRLWTLPALPNLSGDVLRDDVTDSSRNVKSSTHGMANGNPKVDSSSEYQHCVAAGATEHTGRIWDIASARDGQWAVRNFYNIEVLFCSMFNQR